MVQTSLAGGFARFLLLAAAICLIGVASDAQNITTNGSFETQPYDTNGSVSGWSVSGNTQIAETTEGATDGTHSATFNVGADSAGSILSQGLSTSAGHTYLVEFDSGITGQSTGTLQLNLHIAGLATLLDCNVTLSSSGFHHYHFTFVADGATTTLQLGDIGLGNLHADTLVDAVSVQSTPAAAAGTLPLTNADFETGPYDQSTITGWTVGGTGDLSSGAEGATSGTHSAVFNGGHDSQSNTLSQTFATTVGQFYNLDFDAAIYGQHTGGPLQFRAQVFNPATGSSVLDQTVLPPEAGTFNPGLVGFGHYHFGFTATSTASTLQFSDIGTGAGSADTLLDSVSVAVAMSTPTPTPIPTPTPTPTPVPTPTPTTLPLNNGSFEAAPERVVGTITGWTVGGNMSIAAIAEGATDGTHSAAFSAGGDSTNNILSQRFVTSPGQVYLLDFDAGISGLADSTLQLSIKVLGSGTIVNDTVTPPDAETMDPAQVQFQHRHYSFTADAAVTTLQFTAPLVLGNATADLLVDKVSILPQPLSFGQWQSAHFNASQLMNQNISGWSADPDHDGVPNGLEYFSNTDPLAGVSQGGTPLPRMNIQFSGGSHYITFSYRRLLGWPGNPEVVAVSDNLSTWDTTGNQIELIGTPVSGGDGQTEIVTVQLKTPLEQGLHRKNIQLQLNQ